MNTETRGLMRDSQISPIGPSTPTSDVIREHYLSPSNRAQESDSESIQDLSAFADTIMTQLTSLDLTVDEFTGGLLDIYGEKKGSESDDDVGASSGDSSELEDLDDISADTEAESDDYEQDEEEVANDEDQEEEYRSSKTQVGVDKTIHGSRIQPEASYLQSRVSKSASIPEAVPVPTTSVKPLIEQFNTTASAQNKPEVIVSQPEKSFLNDDLTQFPSESQKNDKKNRPPSKEYKPDTQNPPLLNPQAIEKKPRPSSKEYKRSSLLRAKRTSRLDTPAPKNVTVKTFKLGKSLAEKEAEERELERLERLRKKEEREKRKEEKRKREQEEEREREKQKLDELVRQEEDQLRATRKSERARKVESILMTNKVLSEITQQPGSENQIHKLKQILVERQSKIVAEDKIPNNSSHISTQQLQQLQEKLQKHEAGRAPVNSESQNQPSYISQSSQAKMSVTNEQLSPRKWSNVSQSDQQHLEDGMLAHMVLESRANGQAKHPSRPDIPQLSIVDSSKSFPRNSSPSSTPVMSPSSPYSKQNIPRSNFYEQSPRSSQPSPVSSNYESRVKAQGSNRDSPSPRARNMSPQISHVGPPRGSSLDSNGRQGKSQESVPLSRQQSAQNPSNSSAFSPRLNNDALSSWSSNPVNPSGTPKINNASVSSSSGWQQHERNDYDSSHPSTHNSVTASPKMGFATPTYASYERTHSSSSQITGPTLTNSSSHLKVIPLSEMNSKQPPQVAVPKDRLEFKYDDDSTGMSALLQLRATAGSYPDDSYMSSSKMNFSQQSTSQTSFHQSPSQNQMYGQQYNQSSASPRQYQQNNGHSPRMNSEQLSGHYNNATGIEGGPRPVLRSKSSKGGQLLGFLSRKSGA